ncbi:MAG TPA: universal stress protein [Pseudonocardiaceae bacterium]|jgi:nucleotide-binding universal stress UspA family protein|nr:universal stress protein [Pseudonocardiaceae bacterium]
MSEESRKIGRIVVGVDGSAGSRGALRWALDLAGLTGGEVDVVAAWTLGGHLEWTTRMTNYGLITLPETPGREDVQAAVEGSVAEMVAAAAGSAEPDQVTRQVHEGRATAVLLDAAAAADLLVLGRRGHSGLAAALLGSVSRHCVDHASCPVVVVPADE